MKKQENEVKETFTMVDDKLLSTSISRITAQQKLLISWVLRFQKNKLECFASNKHIADTFGMSKDGVKSLLKSCSHSFPTFFRCTPDTRDNGVPYHTISIDLEKLLEFIDGDIPVAKIKRRNKPSTENKALETIISSQIIEADQVEMKVSEIEDNAANGSTEIKLQELSLINIKELSDFKSKYNCFIPKVLLEYMYLVEGKLGLENKLKKIYNQTDFNLELLDILKEQHNREVLV